MSKQVEEPGRATHRRWVALAIVLLAAAVIGSALNFGGDPRRALVPDVAALLLGPVLCVLTIPRGLVAVARRIALLFAPAIAAIIVEAVLVLPLDSDRPRLLLAVTEVMYITFAAVGFRQLGNGIGIDVPGFRLRAMLVAAAIAQVMMGGRLMWFAALFGLATVLILVVPAIASRAASKYRKSGVPANVVQANYQALLAAATDQHLFRNPELTLSQLAAAAGVRADQASQALSQAGGTSFPELVALLRAEEAARLLALPANAGVSVEPIGMEAGFRSRSNFYAAFKRAYGVTPVEYRAAAPH